MGLPEALNGARPGGGGMTLPDELSGGRGGRVDPGPLPTGAPVLGAAGLGDAACGGVGAGAGAGACSGPPSGAGGVTGVETGVNVRGAAVAGRVGAGGAGGGSAAGARVDAAAVRWDETVRVVVGARGGAGGTCGAVAGAGAATGAAWAAGAAGSSGEVSRRRPSASALRRTRSAWASSIDDEWLFTPMPRDIERSSASLLVSPSSRASS
jgi:hypothetical protein